MLPVLRDTASTCYCTRGLLDQCLKSND